MLRLGPVHVISGSRDVPADEELSLDLAHRKVSTEETRSEGYGTQTPASSDTLSEVCSGGYRTHTPPVPPAPILCLRYALMGMGRMPPPVATPCLRYALRGT